MCSSHGLRLEPHPSGRVLFQREARARRRRAEVSVRDYQGYLISFQGSVGSLQAAFYYNWRDMLEIIRRDSSALSTPDMEPVAAVVFRVDAEFPAWTRQADHEQGELKIALRDQLCLHSKFGASLGLQALSSRCCEEAIDRYRDHRLARRAGSWAWRGARLACAVSAASPSGGSARSQRDGRISDPRARRRSSWGCCGRGKCPRHVFPLGEDMRRLHPSTEELTDRTRDWRAASALAARGLLEAFLGSSATGALVGQRGV
ncbi:hypothetical protein Q5P01_000982 [Channa striata]|uniref:Uncharacterized protein n=1 Tax=Channa striata TaxID=64152 RepID=A0AA88LM40_CHASR|nr:hypothetical protein Q5P01_000982 [Channa striata]